MTLEERLKQLERIEKQIKKELRKSSPDLKFIEELKQEKQTLSKTISLLS